MSTDQVMDFLEEETYEEESTPTTLPTVEEEPQTVPLNPKPNHNQKRITAGNALLIAFIGKFPGATSAACSLIAARQDRAAQGELVLPTVKGTDKRLRKLLDFGVITRHRSRTTGIAHYGITDLGLTSAWSYGYGVDHSTKLSDKSKTRVTHYELIAMVAAQFMSPTGWFRDTLGIEPVGLDQLISENEMRAAYEPVKEELKRRKKKDGDSDDFGKWRNTELTAALSEVNSHRVALSDVPVVRPALLTIGQPQRDGAETKAVHQPDLAVLIDSPGDGLRSSNLMVEVERSRKSWAEYHSILKTIKMELEHGFIYDRAVYFTLGTQVETLLRKVDARGKFNLFDSGRLVVLPIVDENNEPIKEQSRIGLGGF